MKPIRDNRKYPRIEHTSEVVLSLPDKQTLATEMFDISSDGIQVRFDKEVAIAMTPALDEIINKSKDSLTITFSMDSISSKEDMTAECEPIYFHKIEDDRYALGMQFREMDVQLRDKLQGYIESSMEPL